MRLLILTSLLLITQDRFFDAGGYYSPTDGLFSMRGLKLRYISLRNVDYYDGGKATHENPKILSPEVIVAYTYIAKDSIIQVTNRVTVNRDTVVFSFVDPEVGTISFRGGFLDKRGQFWNQNDIAESTIVLAGLFRIQWNDSTVTSRRFSFTYFSGD